VLVLLAAAGCALLPSPAGRQAAAGRIAREGGVARISIPASPFTQTAIVRLKRPGAPLQLYIEGDGAAWIDRAWRSSDPTPKNQLVLQLAALDPGENVAYLARPGQYPSADAPPCDPSYWSDRRFTPEVVAAMDAAVEAIAARGKTGRIHLIGYSGGAAIAVLIAAGRPDVASLRTVAGNLDPEGVNRHHGVSPLPRESLDPLAAAAGLCRLPQRHFVGLRDEVVPPSVARTFVTAAGFAGEGAITAVSGASHGEGWREQWKSLLAIPSVSCK
jgi:pimeloyl-ACP methyl ester carboxylesterase